MAKSYRSKGKVLKEILTLVSAEGPIGITRLTASANLTHARLQEHLAEFESNGLIEPQNTGDRIAWVISEKGLKALEELRRIERAMQDFGLHL